MVPTPDKNPVVIVFFGKIIGFLRIKSCSLFALEFAQKFHDLHFFCELRPQPAPAMGEFFTLLLLGGERTFLNQKIQVIYRQDYALWQGMAP
jgi:hypothetical protein